MGRRVGVPVGDPLNLGNDDLYNLLNLLVEEEFYDRNIFPLQLEPNKYLNAAASELLGARESPHRVLETLDGIHRCQLAEAVTSRVEWDELQRLLGAGRPLDWREVAEVKRLLAELNTLSNVLTRTRKVDVPGAKAVREPLQIQVAWTPEERDLYDGVRAWALERPGARPPDWFRHPDAAPPGGELFASHARTALGARARTPRNEFQPH